MCPGDRPAVVPVSSGQLDRPEFDTAALEVVHWHNVFTAHQHPEKTSPAPEVVFFARCVCVCFPQVTDNNVVHLPVNVCSGFVFLPSGGFQEGHDEIFLHRPVTLWSPTGERDVVSLMKRSYYSATASLASLCPRVFTQQDPEEQLALFSRSRPISHSKHGVNPDIMCVCVCWCYLSADPFRGSRHPWNNAASETETWQDITSVELLPDVLPAQPPVTVTDLHSCPCVRRLMCAVWSHVMFALRWNVKNVAALVSETADGRQTRLQSLFQFWRFNCLTSDFPDHTISVQTADMRHFLRAERRMTVIDE